MAQSMQQIKQPKKREGSSVGYFRSGNLPREGNASSSDTMVTNAEFDQQAYSSASFAMHHSGRRSSRGSKKKKGAAGANKKFIPSETGSQADEEEKLNL